MKKLEHEAKKAEATGQIVTMTNMLKKMVEDPGSVSTQDIQNSGLTEDQKKLVTNYVVLIAAETRIEQLKEEKRQEEEGEKAAFCFPEEKRKTERQSGCNRQPFRQRTDESGRSVYEGAAGRR